MLLSPVSYLRFTETLQFTESHRDWMMVLVRGDRRNKRDLVGCASTTLPTMAFAAPIRVIRLDDAVQGLNIISFLHDFHQFVFNAPSTTVTHTELAF